MTSISISELKVNPGLMISQSEDYPVAIQKRNKVQAYIIGKELFEKMISFIEDELDREAVRNTRIRKGISFEKVAHELGI